MSVAIMSEAPLPEPSAGDSHKLNQLPTLSQLIRNNERLATVQSEALGLPGLHTLALEETVRNEEKSLP